MVISPFIIYFIHPIFPTDLWGVPDVDLRCRLRKDLDSTLALDLGMFENEAVAWSNFLLASCFMMVFLFGGLVQYLSPLDWVDRVAGVGMGWLFSDEGWVRDRPR